MVQREQRALPPTWMRPGSPQPGQACQKPGSGRVQVAQSGAVSVPLRMGRSCPQPVQRAHRCLQARHHGCPVVLEIRHGPVWPQIAQVPVGQGRQAWQSGPSGVRTLTGRRRRQVVQVSWFAGCRSRQVGHSGRPCSSRLPGSRTAPHSAQDRARVLATQLRQSHCPAIRRCRWMWRRQCGQAGGVIVCVPAATSRSISRNTQGAVASAPAPVRRSGRSYDRKRNPEHRGVGQHGLPGPWRRARVGGPVAMRQ